MATRLAPTSPGGSDGGGGRLSDSHSRGRGRSPTAKRYAARNTMAEETYETLNIEGGRHVKMWTKGVPVDEQAKGQLANMARLPFVHSHLAVMPDVHVGKGASVGSVIATRGAIAPAAVRVGHRLRHDGRADLAAGERPAGIAVGFASAHRARGAARLRDGEGPRQQGRLGRDSGFGAHSLERARGSARRHRCQAAAARHQGAAQAA